MFLSTALIKQIKQAARRGVTVLTLIATTLWSVGVSMLIPQAARAAITVTGPVELIPPAGLNLPANSFDSPILKFSLTQSASETLSSVTVTLDNAAGSSISAGDVASLSVYRDSNGNNFFEPQNDALSGTQNSVNIGSTTAITTGSNNSLAAVGGLATTFFVVARTGAGWAQPDAFRVSMATNGIATSANSPTLSSAFTGVNNVDANVGMGGGFGGGSFRVEKATFVNATTVDVVFSDFLDLNSGQATSTANYTLATANGGDNSAVTSVTVLPDNRSVRVVAGAAQTVGSGTDTLAVSANVKNQMGSANTTTGPTACFDSFQPLVISEIKVGASGDQYDEFIEVYNRSGNAVATSTLKLHLVNADGSVDVNAPLTFLKSLSNIPSNGFLLIAPITSPASSTADAVYTTSSIASIIPNGAAYISNSPATSTAVTDRVCWGTHTPPSDCEGQPAAALLNDGTSLERKANNQSTITTMASGGTDATNGNGQDSNNNAFDFVARTTPDPQRTNTAGNTEAPGGGSFGGASNQAPGIQHAPIFLASASSTFTVVARMTDDGGQLNQSNVQMFYCVTNTDCAPATSTPIFGTSIGSGWYKFSTTATVWSDYRSILKYYLQAADSATPAKTKIFTADPSFDSSFDTSSNGIQTSALQQSKSLRVTLQQGNLGPASISGTVVNTSNAVVSGATAWIEGTQFSATTASDGSFSFANVGPSGGRQLKVAKDGSVDQSMSIFVPGSGLVSLPTITLYSGTMGVGGDFSLPKVVGSNPPPNGIFPTQSPTGGAPLIFLNFNKAMDSTTITDTDASNAGSNIYLTEAGSNTKLGGAVTYNQSGNQLVFTPAAALTVGKGYTLFVTPGVKDSSGNPVSGNGPGGQYVLMFSTAGQFFTSAAQFTSGGGGAIATFGQGNAFPPYVRGSMPAPGVKNVALNTRVFVSFSEAMQDTSDNRALVKFYQVSNPFTSSEVKNEVSTTNSFDSSGKILTVIPGSSLTASRHYRVEVLGGIKSSKGITLGSPSQTGFATQVFYKGGFDAGISSDSTAPQIKATIPADSATGVSTVQPIVVNFSEAMDPTTITSDTVSLKSGSNAVDGTMSYDTNTWTAKFVPTYALTASSTYTISVSTDVKDLAQQALASALQRTFTTGSADTSSPTVVSAQGSNFAFKVTFSKPMLAVPSSDTVNYGSSALKPENYAVRQVNALGEKVGWINVTSTGVTFSYDAGSRSVSVSGLPIADFIGTFTPGTTLIHVQASTTIKDIGFVALDSTSNAVTSTAQSSGVGGSFGGGFTPITSANGTIVQGGAFGPPPNELASFSAGNIGFIPSIKVFPFNSMAGVSTIYGVEVPVSKQVPAGGFIDITFPEGTDVSQAKKDTNSPKNGDINGPGIGTVVFATSEGTLPAGWATGGAASDGVIVNTSANTVRVILGSVATRSEGFDFLSLDIAQVINSTIVSSVGTSGNSATVETKQANGTVIESFTSGSFFNTAAGSFTVRGRVLAGETGLNGANVFLMSPLTGQQSTSSAANRFGGQAGEFMFQNLVTSTYMLGVEQFVRIGGTDYTGDKPATVSVSFTACVSGVCTTNLSLTDASTGATVTLSISGVFSNDAVDIFASGPSGFRVVTTTLNGTLANNTANSVKLNSNGTWFVGYGPGMQGGMFTASGPVKPPSWIIPKPKQVQVTGCPSACAANPSTLTFSTTAADKPIKFSVRDQSGNAVGRAHVFAYSPGLGQGVDTTADADGSGTVSSTYGTYKVGADFPGLPSGVERTISIKNDGGTDKVFIDGSATGIALASMTSSSLVLTLSKPSYTISGKVTDGTNPVTNAPVFAFRTDGPGHSDSFTNSSGEYTLYVNNGTWKVSTMLPEFGKLPDKTINISGANASGQNFEPETSSVTYYTLTKSVVFDTNGDGSYTASADTEVANAMVTVSGTTGDLNNDGDTSDTGENASYTNTVYTDGNGSSTLKLPPGTYTMEAWSPATGNFPLEQTITINSDGMTAATGTSALLSAGNNNAPAAAPGTVIVNILDVNGNVTTTDKIVVEFQQIGGTTSLTQEFGGTASTTVSLPKFDITDAVALGTVTSTSPTNFYLMTVVIPGVAQSDLSAYGPSATVMATSSATAGLWKVEVDQATETINIRLPDLNTISGTVTDENGNAVADAKVVLKDANGETLEMQADSSGNYSTKVSDGTYKVYAEKDGFIDTATTVTVTTSTALAAAATKVDAFDYTISGTITAGGSAVADATVKAEQLGGGIVMATTGSDGTYTLPVTSGDWKVSATADGYTEKTYGSSGTTPAIVVNASANVSSIDVSLSTQNTSLAGATSLSLTPQTGGVLSDSGANLNVEASGGALSNSSDSALMSSKEVSNVVGLAAGTPIGGEAKKIESVDGDGNAVTTLNDEISVSASYSAADLASSLGTLTIAKIEQVHMGSLDETTDNWEQLPTTVSYKDSSGNFVEPNSTLSNVSSVEFTGQTVHLSVFNPITSSDGLAPAAPTSPRGSFSATTGAVTVTWTAPTTNADSTSLSDLLGYEVYRSTSANGTYTQLNNADITVASYTDSTAVQGTTYYYKITAADTGGLESAMSSASSGVSITSVTGGQNISASGSPSSPSTPSSPASPSQPAAPAVPATPAITPTAPATTAAPAPAPATPAAAAPEVSNPVSAVVITPPAAATVKSGASVKFEYQYQNETGKKQTVKFVRQLVSPKGKVVSAATTRRVLKADGTFTTKVNQAVPRSLPGGEYTVRIKVLDAKGKVLEQNSFMVTVAKPASVKPALKKAAPAKKAAPVKKAAPKKAPAKK